MAATSAPAPLTVGPLEPSAGTGALHPHEPESPPLPSQSQSHTLGSDPVTPAVLPLGEDYEYDYEYGLRDGSSGSGRDRWRVEKWLEQQCRFAPLEADPAHIHAADEEKGRVDSNADEEAVLPEKDATLREGDGGSRAGISTHHDSAEEALASLPLALLLSEAAAAPPIGQGKGEGEHGADRADSPLLGYAPESSEVGLGGGTQEARQDPNPDRNADPNLDPLRFPGRNYSYQRELPVDSPGPGLGLVSHPDPESMAGEDTMKMRDVLALEKEKPLPRQPHLSVLEDPFFSPTLASEPSPTNPEEEDHTQHHNLHTGTVRTSIINAPTTTAILATATTTSSNSTPESSFTVPSAVSAPSLRTPPPPFAAPLHVPEGTLVSPAGGAPLAVESSSSGSAHEEPQSPILEYPLLSMTLSLSLPSPLSFPGLSGLSGPSSPAYTSSNSTSTFTTQQQQQQQQQQLAEMKNKKKHSPAPSYSSSNTASSSSHSYSHSRSNSKTGSVAGSHSSSSRPLLSRSASTSSFSRQHGHGIERQRKAYLPFGPTPASSSSANHNHSRTSSNFSISAASSSSGAAGGYVPAPVARPERKSSLANLRTSIVSTAAGVSGGTTSPGASLSRRPSRTMHAVLSESSELEEKVELKDEGRGVGGVSRPERKSSLVNLRASTATIGAAVGGASPPLSRRPSRTLTSAVLSESLEEVGAGAGAKMEESRAENEYDVLERRSAFQLRTQIEASALVAAAPTTSGPTPTPVQQTGVGMGVGVGMPMYHLPTAMLRASRSSSQLLLDAVSASSTLLMTPQVATSPLPPTAPPTRRQSRAAEVPYGGGGGHVANLSISSSVASSSSRSRSRSRAGSITLNGFSNPNSNIGHAHSMSTSSSIVPDSASVAASTASSASCVRHAVYIDSEEVRERLDELLARVGSDQSMEFERPWMYAASEDEDEGGGEVYSGLLMQGGGGEDEEEGDRTFTGTAGMTTTATTSTGGTVVGDGHGNVMQMQGQDRQERRDAHTHAQHPRGLLSTRIPSALNLNLNMDTTMTTHSPPPAPANTPATFISLSTASTVPATPVSASASTGTYNTLGSPGIYENPHASSSQVYIGPAQLQQGQASSSSPSRSSDRSAGGGGVHSRDTSRSSNSNSNSHSSSGHSHPSLSLSRTQSRTQIHSRTSSTSHSRTHSHSHSRSHSRAASKEKSVMSMSMSPKQILAQLPPTPLSAPAATSTAMSGGEQSPLPPMSMSMSIPVPLRLPPLPSASWKPNRPPPAPPLDLGGVDVDVGAVVPAGEVMVGDEHEERMRDMMLAVGPDADEQLGVDPVVSMASGGFVDVVAEMDVIEERMTFARGHDDEEGVDAHGYESDDGFEVVRRRKRVSVRVPVVPVEEVRRVEGGERRDGEESGSEGEEMTAEDIERMQFLRGLKLEDRIEMPDMPADLDKMLVEFPRAPGSLPPTPERVLPRSSAASQPEVHFAEDGTLLVATPPRGGLDVPAGPSMSRWSLTSSTMDESPSGADGKEKDKKEKDRKRKSFVSFGAGKEKDKESGNLSPGWSEGEKEFGGKDKEKKRGRLASFISRLSNVGGPAPLAISSSSSGSMNSSSEDVPPPVPSVPALSLLLPSPQILDSSKKKEKEKEALPPLPSDVPELMPGKVNVHAHASPRSTPTALKLDLSKTQSQTTQKYVVEKDDVEVAGSVKGVWISSATSTTTTTAPAKASKSVPGSPVDIAYARAVMGMPTFSFARSAPKSKPKPKKPAPPSHSHSAQQPLGKASSDGSIGSKPSTSTSTSKSTKDTDQSYQLGRERSNSTTGSNGPLAKRPPLVKSASASILRQVPVPPKMSRAGSAAPVGPAAAHLQTYPPQPESQHQRAQYQGQYHHQLQYEYRAPQVVDVDGSVPPTPSSLASTDVEEEVEGEEEVDPEMERMRREKAHEERWARVRIEANEQEAVSDGVRQQQLRPHADSPVLQRPRLKSMSSLGNLHSASASAAALSNFPPAGQLSPKSGKGFRGFVERMGLVGSSASNTPVSSYPGTPLNGSSPGPLSVSIPGSASASTAAFPLSPTPEVVEATPTTSWSPSHSPATSLSGVTSISGGANGPGPGSVSLLGKRGAKGPKRKLVISGVELEDVKGYEAVKSWCESFGEVREMTRASNGSLYVDFKKASVAETVCRLQAQVYIKGAGSVSLSWYTKKKPT